jgi:hypothetical protein
MARERTEFGFARTSCGCASCVAPCRVMPGFLVYSDVRRLYAASSRPGEDLFAWAERTLLASMNTKVLKDGKVRPVATLCPAREDDGSCVHLDDEGLCKVHDVSPYGCAFFDDHMPDREGKARSHAGVASVCAPGGRDGLVYRSLWLHLWQKYLRVPPRQDDQDRLHRIKEALNRD